MDTWTAWDCTTVLLFLKQGFSQKNTISRSLGYIPLRRSALAVSYALMPLMTRVLALHTFQASSPLELAATTNSSDPIPISVYHPPHTYGLFLFGFRPCWSNRWRAKRRKRKEKKTTKDGRWDKRSERARASVLRFICFCKSIHVFSMAIPLASDHQLDDNGGMAHGDLGKERLLNWTH